MKSKYIVALIAVTLVITGCATTQTDQTAQIYTPESQAVYVPNSGQIAEAEVGQTMISKSYAKTYPAIILDKDWSEYIQQPMTNNRWSGTIVVPAGTLVKGASDGNGSFYKSMNGYYEALGSKSLGYEVGVYVPNDDKRYSVLYVYHKSIGATGYELGSKGVMYKLSKYQDFKQGSIKKELIYNGVSQKSISISYREFKDEMARPAFTQDLKYDLKDGDVIGFKGARFQILKASNTSIRYKVIKQLD